LSQLSGLDKGKRIVYLLRYVYDTFTFI